MDDVTLGKLLTEAHRGQADYCNPESVSVSQSSSSVEFDRAGKPAGERDVDQSIGFGDGNFENAVVKNQGTKQRVQRILGDCWQWETNGQCVKGKQLLFPPRYE